jgi:hypothetical protein
MLSRLVEEADSLAQLITKDIRKHRVYSLSSLYYESDVRQVWRVDRGLTGKLQSEVAVAGVTAHGK